MKIAYITYSGTIKYTPANNFIALLKTPWDYHRKFEQFNTWLDTIEALNIRLLNDDPIIRWNMDKYYLAEILAAGFAVIPSIFLNQGWNDQLQPLFEKLGAEKLILKPRVSGGSKNTIVKKPKAGDFRVRQIFGGTIETVTPEQRYIDQAAKYISQYAGNTLFSIFLIIPKPRNGIATH